jgi:hypothetical protein
VTEHLPWILVVLGLTYIVSESAIFMAIRIWLASVGGPYAETLVYCPACTGFWAGVFVGILGKFHVVAEIPSGDAVFWMPFASCAIGALYGHFRGDHPTYEAYEAPLIAARAQQRDQPE